MWEIVRKSEGNYKEIIDFIEDKDIIVAIGLAENLNKLEEIIVKSK